MKRPRVTRNWWRPVAVIVAAMEMDALAQPDHEGTLSRFFRHVFRTHTRTGRITFAGTMAVFTWHILSNNEGAQ